MHVATESTASPTAVFAPELPPAERDARFVQYKVIRRNGAVVGF
jgi:hypothetical protein